MAEDIFDEKDEELVVIETTDENFPAEEPADDADEDGDDEDERLATSEDDDEEEVVDKNKKVRETRAKRRELQRRARDNAKRELEFLRQQNADLVNRVQAIEGNTYTQQAQTIEQRYQQAVYEAQQAEAIMARAVEAGNGDDMAQALRIRDEAKDRAQQLAYQHQQAQQYAQQAAQPRSDPRVVDYAKQWMEANQWYNPQGRDEDSAITKAIDNALAAEGWNPASEEYWHELTSRVAARIGGADEASSRREATPRRKAPPTGNTREHTPTRTRNEVVVTPERKAAMIEAGIWDDPVRRTSQLKAYQAYDRENSAR